LKPVLVALATDQPLDAKFRDHDLSGDWAGYRECCRWRSKMPQK